MSYKISELFASIYTPQKYAVCYEVYHHPPFLLIRLYSTGSKCKLNNFNQYNFRVYIRIRMFVAMYYFVPPFRKVNFCGVPSINIVKCEISGSHGGEYEV